MPRPDPQAFARVRRAPVPWRALQAPAALARRGVASMPDPPTEPSDRLPYPEIWGWPYGFAVRHTIPMQGWQGPNSENSYPYMKAHVLGRATVSGTLSEA